MRLRWKASEDGDCQKASAKWASDKRLVDWSWAVVFIPLWIVLSLSAVGVLYALVLSIVLARSRHLVPSHRRQHVTSALFHACLVVPALICMVLLTGKLDALEWGDNDPAADMPFTV
ncbi:unnamed protein product [Strongylus vulgaris]|uniref:Uncharacterized protein n=1 Tax=Strongylus vulgaris TaxID=40348 RepID=A0A3P7JWU4_STRVU|nr:unnamed protein product [Strongylus vulgaris]